MMSKCILCTFCIKLLDGTYRGWTYDIGNLDVVFEDNSSKLELILTNNPPIKNWKFIARIRPLIVRIIIACIELIPFFVNC